jgi:hypothetical protein
MNKHFVITEEEREKVLENFFKQGVNGPLEVFPSKEKRKYIVLQEIIKRFESEKVYLEKEVNEILKAIHPDFATIRRYLIDYRFMKRSDDGREYEVYRD